MGAVDRKLKLFEALVQQRRAGRSYPDSAEIAAVQRFLERELGATVSRRLAARCLGVSHSALGRWAASGDLPLIYTADGRLEVPVSALVTLYEHAAQARAEGRRHVLEPKMAADRAAASRLTPEKLVVGVASKGGEHGRSELRALAYHRALAQKLHRADVSEAQHRLLQWRHDGKIDERYAQRWELLLHRPLPEIRRAIGEDSQDARDLRQNSPFAGALSEAERRKILTSIV